MTNARRRPVVLLCAHVLATISLLFPVSTIADTPAMYLVYFEQIPVGGVERGIIDKASEPVLQNAIEAFGYTAGSCIRVVGYYDRTGPAQDRLKKSQVLAKSVADYLVARGIPASSLTVTWVGDADATATSARQVLVLIGSGNLKSYCY